MVKVFEEEFPMGSYKGQRSPGYFIDGFLQENLDVCIDKTVDDMDFVFLVTGSGMVRNGKSAITQQCAYYIYKEVNKRHGLNNTFDIKHIVFSGEDLIERGLELPPHSVLILDEGDDLTEHYFKKITKDMKMFFRKCGQKNHFLFLILPDFFDLPKFYAINRSIALINVKFTGKFERGTFDFFNFEDKKWLYIMGKKFINYNAQKPSFSGKFPGLYTINEEDYRKKKEKDLVIAEENKDPRRGVEKITKLNIMKRILTYEDKWKFTKDDLMFILGIPPTTLWRYTNQIVSESSPV